ncbi:adenylate kinase [Streptomyces sp. NPDC058394]|uniref:adenylate kinase n=1 Tax=Streptomyces sp. NPDC058394 TaxID=3346477 RepID=UPI003653C122
MRVAVFGLPGTGKTTLAQYLATRTNSAVTSLDDVLFTLGGPLPLEEFRTAAARVTDGPQWIVEGNYSKLAAVVWHRADILVWRHHLADRTALAPPAHRPGAEPHPAHLPLYLHRPPLRTAQRVPQVPGQPVPVHGAAEKAAALGVEVLRFHRPRQARDWPQDATLATGATDSARPVVDGPYGWNRGGPT